MALLGLLHRTNCMWWPQRQEVQRLERTTLCVATMSYTGMERRAQGVVTFVAFAKKMQLGDFQSLHHQG
jgi:hypothetical protein